MGRFKMSTHPKCYMNVDILSTAQVSGDIYWSEQVLNAHQILIYHSHPLPTVPWHSIIITLYPFTLKMLQDLFIFACVYYYEPVDSYNEKPIFVEEQG